MSKKDATVEAVMVIAFLIAIVAGGLFIADHVTCWNFLGLAKGCAVVAHP